MSTTGGAEVVPVHAATMRQLEAQVKTCPLCRLAKTRTNAVPGDGNTRAEVMFIGEGPGYHEDKQGHPFVGAAGQFLNELLGLAGFSRESVFITNVVKCRPPNNRDPQPDEIEACAPYLERQIALVNPQVIVTLGRYSMSHFFPGERISQIHGTARIIDGRMCVAMYHPAAGLHQASLADVIRADFRKLPVFIEQSRKMQAVQSLSSLPEAAGDDPQVAPAHGSVDTAPQTAMAAPVPAASEESDLFSETVVSDTHLPPEVQLSGGEIQMFMPGGDAGRQDGHKPQKRAKAAKKANREGYEQLSFFNE